MLDCPEFGSRHEGRDFGGGTPMIPILLGTAFSSPDVIYLFEKQKAIQVLKLHTSQAEKYRAFANKTNDNQDRNANYMESQLTVMRNMIEIQKAKNNPDMELIVKIESLIERTEKLIQETRKAKIIIPK
jgi:hypothetical protein